MNQPEQIYICIGMENWSTKYEERWLPVISSWAATPDVALLLMSKEHPNAKDIRLYRYKLDSTTGK